MRSRHFFSFLQFGRCGGVEEVADAVSAFEFDGIKGHGV
jgi:hypothetical protein